MIDDRSIEKKKVTYQSKHTAQEDMGTFSETNRSILSREILIDYFLFFW